jgi:N-acetylated-alpha-linked acidic dipeptidase
MEEARAVSLLALQGEKPKRTLVYCAWGAEEPGLIGSTEWVETYAEELKQKAVAYINTDGSSRGFLRAGGSHTLEKFFDPITQQVQDPVKDASLFERAKAFMQVTQDEEWSCYKLYALGSGSDYSPFFQHLGVASFNLGFSGEGSGGEYHTMYDSYEMFRRFKDPDFQYCLALAKVAGRISLRLANAELLPFEFGHFYQTVQGYMDEVTKLADDLREQTIKENQLINNGYYALAANPHETFIVPDAKEPVPHFNFAPLMNAFDQLKQQAEAYDKLPDLDAVDKGQFPEVNQVLKDMESALTRTEGLPRRPWFKHHIYAPGFYTGYGVKTLPGVREALEQRNFEEVQEQIDILAEVLQKFTAQIEKAVSLISNAEH